MFSAAAIKRTAVLLFAILLMSVFWIFRMPEANMLIIVFTFLSSAFLVDVRPFRTRLALALLLALYASAAQFLFSVSSESPGLQILLSALFAWFAFSTLPDYRTGCIVMITGYLAFSAPPGFLPAASRCIDILTGIIVIMFVTTVGNMAPDSTQNTPVHFIPCSRHRSLILAAQLGTGNLLFKILQLKQGAWIMLTIMFITMSETPQLPGRKLAVQRVFAVPAGIITGGFLLDTFCRTDYHFVYLVPVIGAIGFFILYNYGDFFLFSVIFMVALTVSSDWMTGPYHQFHFRETFLSRSIAALLGAVLFLTGEQKKNTGTI